VSRLRGASAAARSGVALVLVTAALGARGAQEADPLPSWREGAAKAAVVQFVARVTEAGGPGYAPPAARIAVFDNDGTLWAEQPVYFQLLFAVDRIKALAPKHPEWKEKEPYASILRGDVKGALARGERASAEIIAATHAGMTTDEFDAVVREWLATARHPRFKRPYTDVVYQPMLELLSYLRANGFRTFIVSGGGVEFMRAFAEQTYGVPPEQVIGSSGKQRFELRGGKPVLVKLPAIDFVDDKEGKAINIHKIIGRRPLAAFGNSDGDLAMLQWTCSAAGARLCLYVHHTDAEREWAYDRQSHIGRLDKGLDEAKSNGWIIASMSADWLRVFPF
jgi:phosphoglycolate phosphatase-like HAD superfamily hydrolase